MITLPAYLQNDYFAKDILFAFKVYDAADAVILTCTSEGNDSTDDILLGFADITTLIGQEALTTVGSTSVEVISNKSLDAFNLEYKKATIEVYKEGETPLLLFTGKIAPPLALNPSSGIYTISLVTAQLDVKILADMSFTAKKPSEHIQDLVDTLDDIDYDATTFAALDANASNTVGDVFEIEATENADYKTTIERLAWIGAYGLLLKNDVLYGFDLRQPTPTTTSTVDIGDAIIEGFTIGSKDETELFTRVIVQQGDDTLTWTRNRELYGDRQTTQTLLGYDLLNETVTTRLNYWLFQYGHLWKRVTMRLPLSYAGLEVYDIVAFDGLEYLFGLPTGGITGRVLSTGLDFEGFVTVTVETNVDARTNEQNDKYWDTGTFASLVVLEDVEYVSGDDFNVTWRRLTANDAGGNPINRYQLQVIKDSVPETPLEYTGEPDEVITKLITLTAAPANHDYEIKVRPYITDIGQWGNWSNTVAFRYVNDLAPLNPDWEEKDETGEMWATKTSYVTFELPEYAETLEIEFFKADDTSLGTRSFTAGYEGKVYEQFRVDDIPRYTSKFKLRYTSVGGASAWSGFSGTLLHDVPDAVTGTGAIMSITDENYPDVGGDTNPSFSYTLAGWGGANWTCKVIWRADQPRASKLKFVEQYYSATGTPLWYPATVASSHNITDELTYIYPGRRHWFSRDDLNSHYIGGSHKQHAQGVTPVYSNAYGDAISGEVIYFLIDYPSDTTKHDEASTSTTNTAPGVTP